MAVWVDRDTLTSLTVMTFYETSQDLEQGQYTMLIVSGLGARPIHYAHCLRTGSKASTLCSWSQGWEQGQYTMLIVSGLGARPVHYVHSLRAGSKASTLSQ